MLCSVLCPIMPDFPPLRAGALPGHEAVRSVFQTMFDTARIRKRNMKQSRPPYIPTSRRM